MRIVGGKYKGRIFHPGKSFSARPTTDFAKENLFNILENRLNWENVNALDLFAGTGSISYELISRGCLSVTSVEMNFRHYRFIEEIKSQLSISNLRVYRDNAFRFVQRTKEKYDLVFADPPFDLRGFENIATTVLNAGILKPEGIFILEHNKSNKFSKMPEFLEIRNYGSVQFSFFKNTPDLSQNK